MSEPAEMLEKPKRGGRRPKASGYRTEKAIEILLAPYGFHRVVASGALGKFHAALAGDLQRHEEFSAKFIRRLEVKRRRGDCRQFRKWLAQGLGTHGLVIATGGHEEPLVVLPMAQFRLLLSEANYQDEPRHGETHVQANAAPAR